MSTQRVKYKKKLKPGSRVSFPKDRIDKLESLGFIWNRKSSYKGEVKPSISMECNDIKQSHENDKEDNIENIQENFKETISHSDIIPIKPKNTHPSLMESFGRVKESEVTNNGLNLVSEKFSEVTPLGTQKKNQYKESHDKVTIEYNKWDLYYKKLVQFKEKFGHVCVSTRMEKFIGLATWVVLERAKFLNSNKGGDPYPTERFEKLNKLGFVWEWNRKNMDDCHSIENENLNINQEQTLDDESDDTYGTGRDLIGDEGVCESDETSTSKCEYTRSKESMMDNKRVYDKCKVMISCCDSTSYSKCERIVSKEKLESLPSSKSTSLQLLPEDGKSTIINDGITTSVSHIKNSEEDNTSSNTFQFLCSSSEEDCYDYPKYKKATKLLEKYHEETKSSTRITMSSKTDLSDIYTIPEANRPTIYSNMPVEEKTSDNGVSPSILQRMISMGFKVSEARQALQDANNDLRLAISIIFSDKLAQDRQLNF